MDDESDLYYHYDKWSCTKCDYETDKETWKCPECEAKMLASSPNLRNEADRVSWYEDDRGDE